PPRRRGGRAGPVGRRPRPSGRGGGRSPRRPPPPAAARSVPGAARPTGRREGPPRGGSEGHGPPHSSAVPHPIPRRSASTPSTRLLPGRVGSHPLFLPPIAGGPGIPAARSTTAVRVLLHGPPRGGTSGRPASTPRPHAFFAIQPPILSVASRRGR